MTICVFVLKIDKTLHVQQNQPYYGPPTNPPPLNVPNIDSNHLKM